MKFRNTATAVMAAAGTVVGMFSTPAEAELLSYYVGIDNLPTIASGTYAGLANPNYNRLTVLFAHHYADAPASNHYHSKSIRTYTGPNTGATTAVTTSASDYAPEGGNPPLVLSAGSDVYAGKLISNAYTDATDVNYPFSRLTFGNTRSLSGFAAGSGEAVMFNSSGGRWNSAYDAADVHLELVGLTPGLHLGSATALDIATTAGNDVHLGGGDEAFKFTPVLWTDANAAPGTYQAVFRIVDESNTFGSSGDFRLVTQVVPEPAAIGLAGLVGVGLLRRVRRV